MTKVTIHSKRLNFTWDPTAATFQCDTSFLKNKIPLEYSSLYCSENLQQAGIEFKMVAPCGVKPDSGPVIYANWLFYSKQFTCDTTPNQLLWISYEYLNSEYSKKYPKHLTAKSLKDGIFPAITTDGKEYFWVVDEHPFIDLINDNLDILESNKLENKDMYIVSDNIIQRCLHEFVSEMFKNFDYNMEIKIINGKEECINNDDEIMVLCRYIE